MTAASNEQPSSEAPNGDNVPTAGVSQPPATAKTSGADTSRADGAAGTRSLPSKDATTSQRPSQPEHSLGGCECVTRQTGMLTVPCTGHCKGQQPSCPDRNNPEGVCRCRQCEPEGYDEQGQPLPQPSKKETLPEYRPHGRGGYEEIESEPIPVGKTIRRRVVSKGTQPSLPPNAICEAHDCMAPAVGQEMARGPRLLNVCAEHRDLFCHGCKSVGWVCDDCFGDVCGCAKDPGEGCVCP